jgi:uncharacterized NAD-dependent epimerase/dehydratase family protein
MILAAIRAGLDIHSGLHTFLGDDPEFADAARTSGVRLIDYRRPPERMETSVGRLHEPGKRVILTVGTDCAIGKMSVALELRRAATASGRSATFVATGQTGMMIEGWGVAVDRVISDFVQGTCEWLSEEGERRGDWVLIEGQGSLDHPAYSSVTCGLIHGFTPQAMVLVHMSGLDEHDWDHLPERKFPLQPLPEFIRASPTRPTHAGSSRPPRPRPGSRAPTRSGLAATPCGPRSPPRWRRCPGCRPTTRGPARSVARDLLDPPADARPGAP